LKALQRRLERHKDVGSVLSIALLMAEAERPWYSFLFSWEAKLTYLIYRACVGDDDHRGRIRSISAPSRCLGLMGDIL
jgi:hypothetical protein